MASEAQVTGKFVLSTAVKKLSPPSTEDKMISPLAINPQTPVQLTCFIYSELKRFSAVTMVIMVLPTDASSFPVENCYLMLKNPMLVRNKEEAVYTSQANRQASLPNKILFIGFMRNGKILAEGKPEEFLCHFNLPNLDDIYLKLCQDDLETSKQSDFNNGTIKD
uniref:Uncharacterized protein n=1 Tax=Strigamia maritima TaxID=126957 RepID=T1IN24_STRMM